MKKSESDLTKKHILRVKKIINAFCNELKMRGINHDLSKLDDPEKASFDTHSPELKKLTYGSEEYSNALLELKPALDHHYANNSHHPEHFENGIYDMNLFDLVEMFIDWKASSERHENGDIFKSIKINKKRFGMSKQLTNIFLNTARYLKNGE